MEATKTKPIDQMRYKSGEAVLICKLPASGRLLEVLPAAAFPRRKSSKESDQELERICFMPVTFQLSSVVSPGWIV